MLIIYAKQAKIFFTRFSRDPNKPKCNAHAVYVILTCVLVEFLALVALICGQSPRQKLRLFRKKFVRLRICIRAFHVQY